MSFLHSSYFAPTRQMRLQAFDHTFTPVTFARIRQPNGEYVVVPQEGTPVMGKLVIATARAAEEAAAKGVKADWIGKVPLGTPIVEGQQFRVTGVTADVGWTETVTVTGDLKGDRINRRFAAMDTDLTQS